MLPNPSLTVTGRCPYTTHTMNGRWTSWIALAALLAALLPAHLWPTACGEPGMGGCCGTAEVSEPCCGAEALQPSDCCSGAPPAAPTSTPPHFAALLEAPASWQTTGPAPGPDAAARVGRRPLPSGGILLEPLFTLHAAFLT